MSVPLGPYFFISYSRADMLQQRKVVAELRGRGVKAWVDTDKLVPGSPAWEREIEHSIRGAAGVIVLLSPDSNNSQWVRRELSFAEENDKYIFPVHIRGDESVSIPLRLSAHQRVDLRRNFADGLDNLANALKDHLGATLVGKKIEQKPKREIKLPAPQELKKYALPAAFFSVGLVCIAGLAFAVRAISNFDVPTSIPATSTPPDVDATNVPTHTQVVDNYPEPTGKIVYTCQLQGDEICIINPDGSGWKRLTDTFASSNASLSPDGQKAVFSLSDGQNTEIYELDVATGRTKQLTELRKSLGSPEISPDDQYIIFHYRSGNNNVQLWIMNRDGSDAHKFYSESGKDAHDPTWSPDGKQILFALGKGENNQLYITDLDGRDPRLVNDTIDTRGRSDWSIKDLISFDQGGPFVHNVYLMNTDGNSLKQLSEGNNSQGASISPDGNWIAFTAYTNVADRDTNSCEIFIMRVDGTDIRQLTNNTYCDYQPRWGK